MDSCKALNNDGSSSKVSWLQCGVLSAGAFSIVLVSNHHPVLSIGLEYTFKTDEKTLLWEQRTVLICNTQKFSSLRVPAYKVKSCTTKPGGSELAYLPEVGLTIFQVFWRYVAILLEDDDVCILRRIWTESPLMHGELTTNNVVTICLTLMNVCLLMRAQQIINIVQYDAKNCTTHKFTTLTCMYQLPHA